MSGSGDSLGTLYKFFLQLFCCERVTGCFTSKTHWSEVESLHGPIVWNSAAVLYGLSSVKVIPKGESSDLLQLFQKYFAYCATTHSAKSKSSYLKTIENLENLESCPKNSKSGLNGGKSSSKISSKIESMKKLWEKN